MNSEVQSLTTALMREGYEIVRGGKHIRVEKDGVMLTTLPLSPSDHRWRKNKVRELISKGMLKRDPMSNYTPPKEEKMPAGGQANREPFSDMQMKTLEALVDLVIETEGLKRRPKGMPYGVNPALVSAVRQYVIQQGAQGEMPKMMHMGQPINWFNVDDLNTGVTLLVGRLLDAYHHPFRKSWQATKDFLDVAVRAYEWWKTPVPEIGVAEAEAISQALMLDQDPMPIVVPEWEKPTVNMDALNGHTDRVSLAIEVAAMVGGIEGIQLGQRVLEVQ